MVNLPKDIKEYILGDSIYMKFLKSKINLLQWNQIEVCYGKLVLPGRGKKGTHSSVGNILYFDL